MAWAVRSLARMVFPTLARHGWSYSRMLKYAKGKGWAYAPKVMALDIREMRNSAEFGRKVMALPDDILVAKTAMSPTELRLPRKYRVFGQATYRNVDTGQLKYTTNSFYTNSLRSKEGFETDFLSETAAAYQEALWRPEGFTILEVQHNIGYPY